MTEIVEVQQTEILSVSAPDITLEVTDPGSVLVDVTPMELEVTSNSGLQVFDVHTMGHYDPAYNPNNPLHSNAVPPIPTGLVANGYDVAIRLTWVMPTYFNHDHTEVWVNTVDDRGTATLIGSPTLNVFTDSALNSADTKYYWIRHVSMNDVDGPWNAVAGTLANTNSVPSSVLSAIQGQIDEQQLTAALKTRLDQIETMGAGLAQELLDRAQADADEVVARDLKIGSEIGLEVTARDAAIVNALAVETADRNAAIATEQTVRFNDVNALEAQYTVKIDMNGHVSGYGLASTLVDDVPLSSMQFAVDQFSIVSPGNADLAFYVDTGANKVMMDAAMVGNLGAQTISITSTGHIKGGQTDYNTGTGFFLGYSGADYKFSLGSSTNNLTWDGTSLDIVGGLKTATGAGQRIEIDPTSNELHLFADAGTSGIKKVISMGVAVDGPDSYFLDIGDGDAGTSRIGIRSRSWGAYAGFFETTNTTTALYVTNRYGTGKAIYANSANNYAITGASSHYNAWTPGVYGSNAAGIGIGVRGSGNSYAFYATGTYGPFTGGHDFCVPTGESYEVGDIVVDGDLVGSQGVSDTIHEGLRSTTANQVAVGVFRMLQPSEALSGVAALKDYPGDLSSYGYGLMNSVGEGQINVCNANGDIHKGDLIVTSSVPGKGMRQDDDLVRSYTVARARESVTWSQEPGTVKMISCIYLCG